AGGGGGGRIETPARLAAVPAFDVVIPARNEETTVGNVVRAALAAPGGGRGVGVNDAWPTGTAAAALAAGARVISTRGGQGDKGRALTAGVTATSAVSATP